MRRVIAMALVLLAAAAWPQRTWAESASGLVEEGNRLYLEKRYDEALERYDRAGKLAPGSPVIDLNIGNALYGKGDYEKAYERYRQAFSAKERSLAQGARFNAGNAHFAQEKWQEAIQQYKEALRLDSADRDAKKNLELALQRLQEQQQQKQQDQNQQQDKNEQQQNQNQQNQNQQPPPQDQQQDQQSGDPSQQQDQQSQSAPQDRDQLSREEAMRILDAMKDQDKPPKDQMKVKPPEKRPEKDW